MNETKPWHEQPVPEGPLPEPPPTPPADMRSDGIHDPLRGESVQGYVPGYRCMVRMMAHPDQPKWTLVQMETGSKGWLQRTIERTYDGTLRLDGPAFEAIESMLTERGAK